jgi:hypothetical protein
MVNSSTTFPPKMVAAVTAWQATALAVLQPSVPLLLPESLLQLLLGCNRISLGLCLQQQQQQGKDTTSSSSSSSSSDAVLSAAVAAVSPQLDLLSGEQCVKLLVGCSSVDAAGQDFGQALLERIEPDLR